MCPPPPGHSQCQEQVAAGVLSELQVGASEIDQHHGQEILRAQNGGEVRVGHWGERGAAPGLSEPKEVLWGLEEPGLNAGKGSAET